MLIFFYILIFFLIMIIYIIFTDSWKWDLNLRFYEIFLLFIFIYLIS